MAQDATGTPTAKGIPKFNTAADSPSGKGFNATMDVIDTLLTFIRVRKNSGGSSFERKRLNLIEGSNITLTVADDATDDEVDVTIASSAATVGYGTSLPGSPTDGQEHILVDSTTLPTYQWRFRWNNGSSNTDKWEFVGGSILRSEVATEESTASTTYVDLATVGPSITVPRAGVYIVHFGSTWRNTTATSTDGWVTLKIGAAASADSNGINPQWAASTGNGESHTWSVVRSLQVTAAASDVLKLQYRSAVSTSFFGRRWLHVVPVRVS